MSLTRKMLKAMGIEDEKVDQIIDAHTEVVDALKAARDQFKEDAEKLPAVQKELDELKAANQGEGGKDALQAKYDKLDKEFKAYKQTVENEKTVESKKAIIKKIAKDAGLSDSGIEKAVKYYDYDSLELDEKGEAKNGDKIIAGLKDEWSAFVQKEGIKGANPATPPDSNPSNPGNTGRAKQIAESYFANLYGTPKKEGT